jgi:hypothetical protein
VLVCLVTGETKVLNSDIGNFEQFVEHEGPQVEIHLVEALMVLEVVVKFQVPLKY